MDLVQECLRDRSLEVLKMAPSTRYRMLTPGLSGGISWSIAARYRKKSVGARTQPCFRPEVTGNSSDSLLSWNTRPDIPSCRARTRPTKCSGHPSLRRTIHMAVLGTLSKAFSRS